MGLIFISCHVVVTVTLIRSLVGKKSLVCCIIAKWNNWEVEVKTVYLE